MTRSSKNTAIALTLLAVIILVAVAWSYLRKPQQIGKNAYDFVTALHSICHRQDADRLNEFSDMLNRAHQSEAISAHEFSLLESIVALAKNGSWESARKKSRQLLEDQVKRIE